MTTLDHADAVRVGEELPLDALADYLAIHAPELRGSLTVAQFPRGYSNLTYLIQVGEQELVLRRPPFGANIAGGHDMGREARVLAGLGRVYDRVPRLVAYCDDLAVIGAPFYVMQRVQGVVLRAADLPTLDISPGVMAGLAVATVDNLAAIHRLDYDAAGLASLGKPVGYAARQVHGWARRYHAAATGPQPHLEAALTWLDAHLPPEDFAAAPPALLHNDYKYDNLILDGDDLTRIVAVLDWEMCTLGDPRLDLGTTLGYWIEAGDPPPLVEMFGVTTLPGNLNRAGVVARYCAAAGCADFDPLYGYVYGVVKIGVILQQIYARYVQGRTHDARFARLDAAVTACGEMAARALAARRISGLFTA